MSESLEHSNNKKSFFEQETTSVALSIAGSDSGGGAGIQADMRVFSSLGVFPTTAITALTAQNPNEVRDVLGMSDEFVASQIHTVLDVFDVKAIKTGMLYSAEIIQKLCAIFSSPQFQSKGIPVVVDPVMIATSGAKLVSDDAIDIYIQKLLPLATIITPNIDEAEVLLDEQDEVSITNENQIEMAHRLHQKFGCAVLLKGGHLEGHPTDIFVDRDGKEVIKQHQRLDNVCTHGTGCSLSAAIAANLAKGENLQNAVALGLSFVQSSLQNPHALYISGAKMNLLGLETRHF
jgi:hydroxymethylpyrimidine/phosphomethylpyrimidine kinase